MRGVETEQQRWERAQKAVLEEGRALTRVQRLADEEGLVESNANATLIGQYLRDHGLALTAENVEFTVDEIQHQLQWKREVAASAPPVAPSELLPNGEPRLSLHADARTRRNASLTQLRDLAKREKANTRKGWFGSNLK
jgi:hypothetical protein